MSVLVIAEHDNQSLKPATANVVTAAAKFNQDIHVILIGNQCSAAAQAAAELTGVVKVLVSENARFEHQLAEHATDVVLTIANQYEAILAPATTSGKNLIPRLAALLDIQPISDVISIESPKVFKRPIYAGNVIAKVETSDKQVVMTVRPTVFDAAPSGGAAVIERLSVEPKASLSEFVEEQLAQSDRPELTAAKVVVSGGRGLANGDNFKLLYQLADKLNAAVGASRAAVDAGFVPNDMQVGQTGKIVAPDLYLAFGISGAIQHLAGMKESKIIVAVNTDEDAPIFQVADYGLVADLFQVLPELTQKL